MKLVRFGISRRMLPFPNGIKPCKYDSFVQIRWFHLYLIIIDQCLYSVLCQKSLNKWCMIYFLNSLKQTKPLPLPWRHNRQDGVSNHQPHQCLLNRLFGRRSKKTSKLRVTGLCLVNSPETDKFPAQMASSAENVSIWWRHHANSQFGFIKSLSAHMVLTTLATDIIWGQCL